MKSSKPQEIPELHLDSDRESTLSRNSYNKSLKNEVNFSSWFFGVSPDGERPQSKHISCGICDEVCLDSTSHNRVNSTGTSGCSNKIQVVQLNPSTSDHKARESNQVIISGTARNLSDVIIAPNVNKLREFSKIEVRLNSGREVAAILCSVDVLKMRSSFFHEVLNHQEDGLRSSEDFITAMRAPIELPEESPYEAAAFLESLHEGRAVYQGEWNSCWARLSVSWEIEDLVRDYASQIDSHLLKVVNCVEMKHWRRNPAVLAGYRVAILRKGSGPIPTVICGDIVEPSALTGYSKVRVLFDQRSPSAGDNSPQTTPVLQPASQPVAVASPPPSPSSSHPSTAVSVPTSHHPTRTRVVESGTHVRPLGSCPANSDHSYFQRDCLNYTNKTATEDNCVKNQMQHQLLAEISEPFWVQAKGEKWSDPDDLFAVSAEDCISDNDRKLFWEMLNCILDQPRLAETCRNPLRQVGEMAEYLKREEFRTFWQSGVALNCFPKEVLMELLLAAYSRSTPLE